MTGRKTVFLFIFLFLSLFSFAQTLPAIYKVNVDELNVRSGPGTEYRIIGKFYEGNSITVVSIQDSQWAKIKYSTRDGYVNRKYISFHQSVPTTNPDSKKSNTGIGDIVGSVLTWILGIGLVVLLFVFREYILIFIFTLLMFCGIGSLITYIFFGSGSIGAVIGAFLGIISFISMMKDDLADAMIVVIGVVISIISFPFYCLNLIQYYLQKPWRFLIRRTNIFSRFASNSIVANILYGIQILLYVALFPIRILNAVYYNIVIHLLMAYYNLFLEVVYPKAQRMRFKSGWKYIGLWIWKLPYRIVRFMVIKGFLVTLESLIFTVFDTFYPTLTMYHGTTESSGISITCPGVWLVGGGNFAGSGIYFGIKKRTARHYAGDGVIIVTRVSLGKMLSVRLAPRYVQKWIANAGDKITDWGLKNGYVSVEWWREDQAWWEYCLLDKVDEYDNPWRIRPLYVLNTYNGTLKRIYGGMSYWLFRKDMM